MNASALVGQCGIFAGLAEAGDEHALALLKPDFDPALFASFAQLCRRSGLTVEEDAGEVRLSPQQHDQLFLDRADDYRDYMTSGPVRPLLLRGPYAVQRLSAIKSAIRLNRNLHIASLRNMLHAADDGIEFQRQATFFFPHKRLWAWADLAITWGRDQRHLGAALAKRSVQCRWIGLLINYADLPDFRNCYRDLNLEDHHCLLGIRLQRNGMWMTLFPSPFNYDLFFVTPPEEQLADAVLKCYGIAALEISEGVDAAAEDTRRMHFTEIERLLEERAAGIVTRLLRQSPNGGRGVMALRTLSPDDSFTSADIARRCAARLGWRTWGGSGSLEHREWRAMSRGAFERLIYAMPEL